MLLWFFGHLLPHLSISAPLAQFWIASVALRLQEPHCPHLRELKQGRGAGLWRQVDDSLGLEVDLADGAPATDLTLQLLLCQGELVVRLAQKDEARDRHGNTRWTSAWSWREAHQRRPKCVSRCRSCWGTWITFLSLEDRTPGRRGYLSGLAIALWTQSRDDVPAHPPWWRFPGQLQRGGVCRPHWTSA
jgi:hypothetical protein